MSAGGVCETVVTTKQDVGGLILKNVVSCCMEIGFLFG